VLPSAEASADLPSAVAHTTTQSVTRVEQAQLADNHIHACKPCSAHTHTHTPTYTPTHAHSKLLAAALALETHKTQHAR